MAKRSHAQRAADARYERNKRRGVVVRIRLSEAQAAWLASHQHHGEACAAAFKRLAGVPSSHGKVSAPNNRSDSG